MKRAAMCFACMLMIISLLGCGNSGSDNDVVTVHNVTLSGTSACPDKSAVVVLTFNTRADSTVTGTITYDGTAYSMTGAYDESSHTVTGTASGSGIQFDMTATYTSGSGLGGVVVRTVASTETTCTVSAQEKGDNETVQNYLGTFGLGTSSTDQGTWNMSVKNGATSVGTYASNGGLTGTFSGTVSNSNLTVSTFQIYYNGQYYDVSDSGVTGSATGAFTNGGSDLSGDWGWIGTFTGGGANMNVTYDGKFVGTLQ